MRLIVNVNNLELQGGPGDTVSSPQKRKFQIYESAQQATKMRTYFECDAAMWIILGEIGSAFGE
eukprot:2074401-Amphidinium_carterae.1